MMKRLPRLVRDRSGTSAVEFALVAPVFLLLLAGTIDLGSMLAANFQLNAAVSAGANHGIVNGSSLSAGTAAGLTTSAAAILSTTSEGAPVSVAVNNGYTTTRSSGQYSTTGSAAEADKCYCPTRTGDAIQWGNAASCGSTCANGAPAGKYMTFTASRPYQPLFGGYGFVEGGQITVRTIAQVQ